MNREIQGVIREAAATAYRKSLMELPSDVIQALRDACDRETERLGKQTLQVILQNAEDAKVKRMVVCQDTGIAEFWLGVGGEFRSTSGLSEEIRRAVEEVTREVPLIPHCVDPLSRVNTGTNTGVNVPILHYDLLGDGEYLEITASPTAGVCIHSPIQHLIGEAAIERFVVAAVEKAGAGCPPFVIGVGIGGPYDQAMHLSRRATLRRLNRRHTDPTVAALEVGLLEAVNRLGMGPMNMGGVTALAVNVETSYTHTACNPVAVRVDCWCARRATVRIHPDGRLEER